jgi:preprotein translocase subunit SecA
MSRAALTLPNPKHGPPPMPGLLWGSYPERRPAAGGSLARLAERLAAAWPVSEARRVRAWRAFAWRAEALARDWQALDDAALESRRRAAQAHLARHGLRGEALVEAFALAIVASRRELGVAPYTEQLLAARALLDDHLVEMATGEGKTLAVAVAAAVAGLAGMPVHVITANDYLVERDADYLGPFHARLGLSVGRVTATRDARARREAYARDITYCTAKELGFDYLRDRVQGRGRRGDLRQRAESLAGAGVQEPLLRGLCMAIVDEADSILIDEARVPLILARAVASAREQADYALALELASRLDPKSDFQADPETRRVRLSDAGAARLAESARDLSPVWANRRYREEWVGQALSALHLYRRDRDYILRDGRVEIVDPTTGRVAVGRSWSRGLHQLIELKEACDPTPAHATSAQITFQRLFRRYHRLAGISGTLRESRGELAAIYALPVARAPLRRPLRRAVLAPRVLATRAELWAAVAARAAELRAQGRPVLIGTDSVADSEALAAHLAEAGIACRVLNARQDKEEADVVALAGRRGQVTVTTNMAGRGTDIPLGAGVEALGGLHVISCQHNAARRIDRQLIGRGARQGSPGSCETLLSLDSELFRQHYPAAWLQATRRLLGRPAGQRLARLLAGLAQRAEEARAAHDRRRMLDEDERVERQLAFGGAME